MATTVSINGSDSPTWSWNEIDWGDWHTILQLVPACIGCLGNLVVIIVLIPPRSQNRSTDILIGHLAVADFLKSIFLLPIPVVRTIPRNWVVLYCGFLSFNSSRFVCILSSIYILLAICCDRFLAVVYPLQFNRWITRGRATLVVVCIWLGSSIGQYTTTFTRLDRAKYECTLKSSRRYSQITADLQCAFFLIFVWRPKGGGGGLNPTPELFVCFHRTRIDHAPHTNPHRPEVASSVTTIQL